MGVPVIRFPEMCARTKNNNAPSKRLSLCIGCEQKAARAKAEGPRRRHHGRPLRGLLGGARAQPPDFAAAVSHRPAGGLRR